MWTISIGESPAGRRIKLRNISSSLLLFSIKTCNYKLGSLAKSGVSRRPLDSECVTKRSNELETYYTSLSLHLSTDYCTNYEGFTKVTSCCPSMPANPACT